MQKGKSAGFIEDRKKAAGLLHDVLMQKITVLDALKQYPKNLYDPTLNAAFHALVHYEADEDIRKQDALYREEQDLYIADIAEILSKGEALPCNIIDEYSKYHKQSLIYPEIDKKAVFERLKKMINL